MIVSKSPGAFHFILAMAAQAIVDNGRHLENLVAGSDDDLALGIALAVRAGVEDAK